MNVEQILVAVMTMAAVAWLVWAELQSRRNSAAKQKKPVAGTRIEEQESEARESSRQVRA